MPARDFRIELSVGYALELFLSMLPMMFIIVFNNTAEMSAKRSAVIAAANTENVDNVDEPKPIKLDSVSGEPQNELVMTPLTAL